VDDAMAKRDEERWANGHWVNPTRSVQTAGNRVSSVALRQSSPVHKPESNPVDDGQCCAYKHAAGSLSVLPWSIVARQ